VENGRIGLRKNCGNQITRNKQEAGALLVKIVDSSFEED
jgi:hypothetical protein